MSLLQESSNAGPVEDAEPEKVTPQTAFARASAGYEFNGAKVPFPYSALRENVALELGFRGCAHSPEERLTMVNVIVGEDGKEIEEKSEIYTRFVRDIQLILWVCHQPDSRVLRASRKNDEAILDFHKWADTMKIRLGSPLLAEAAKTYGEIMSDRDVSMAQPQPEGGEARNGEPGNL